MDQLYYIVSLKHTSKADTALTFWGPDGNGYTWHRDRAGLYTAGELVGRTNAENVPVLKEAVDPYWMNAEDFDDKFIAVPNQPTVLRSLGLNIRFMKPKKAKGCKMVFLNTVPEPIKNK